MMDYDRDTLLKKGYTEKQIAVICGNTDQNSVDGRLAYQMLKKAKANGDQSIIELAEKLREESAERARLNAHERSRKRSRNLLAGTIEWRQPKSNEYSEHHKMVIRGEIPIKQVHTNELIKIHLIAKNNGDVELSERILNVIYDRRALNLEHKKISIAKLHERRNERTWNPNANTLTPYENAVIHLESNIGEYPLEILQHIIKICTKQNDDYNVRIAKALLYYREHPEKLYPTTCFQEAINNIESLLGKPIRRPETWFTD